MADLRYASLVPSLARACAGLELSAFPDADPNDLLSEDDVVAFAEAFPEGFFVVMDGDKVVGQAAGIFLDFDLNRPQHSLMEITGDHQCGNHDPDGGWYYGIDIVVHPDYRRRGIGNRLYELRKDIARRNNKRGIVAGGYMKGFPAHKHRLSAGEYIDQVRSGDLYDPTLTFQMESGFRLVCGLENYLNDTATDNWSALIVWDNPDYVG